MSVWASLSPASSAVLCGSEGELVCIAVVVEPRDLEDLLEALASLEFPINPQIYHDAAVVYVDCDGGRTAEGATLVEFPAYAEQTAKIRAVLETCGFPGDVVSIASMLDEIQGAERLEPAPHGAGYAHRILQKTPATAAAARH